MSVTRSRSAQEEASSHLSCCHMIVGYVHGHITVICCSSKNSKLFDREAEAEVQQFGLRYRLKYWGTVTHLNHNGSYSPTSVLGY